MLVTNMRRVRDGADCPRCISPCMHVVCRQSKQSADHEVDDAEEKRRGNPGLIKGRLNEFSLRIVVGRGKKMANRLRLMCDWSQRPDASTESDSAKIWHARVQVHATTGVIGTFADFPFGVISFYVSGRLKTRTPCSFSR